MTLQRPTEPAYPDATQGGIGLGFVFYAATALFGLVNLFVGFSTAVRDRGSSLSYYQANGLLGWIPALLFLGGLLAGRALLPRAPRPDWLPALVTTAVMVPFVFITIKTDRFGEGLAVGEILFLIFGLLQLVTAWLAVALSSFKIGAVSVQRYPAPQPAPYYPPPAAAAPPAAAPAAPPVPPVPPAAPFEPPAQPPQGPASP